MFIHGLLRTPSCQRRRQSIPVTWSCLCPSSCKMIFFANFAFFKRYIYCIIWPPHQITFKKCNPLDLHKLIVAAKSIMFFLYLWGSYNSSTVSVSMYSHCARWLTCRSIAMNASCCCSWSTVLGSNTGRAPTVWAPRTNGPAMLRKRMLLWQIIQQTLFP